MKFVPPSTKEKSFNCPHCGTLTTQFWYTLRADKKEDSEPIPRLLRESDDRDWDFADIEDLDQRKKIVDFAAKLKSERPFLESGEDGKFYYKDVHNLHLSDCYNCKEISVWIHDRLVYPTTGEAPEPNADLSDEVRRDYDEASAILNLSPRGAAALIRLAIQKVCIELGQPGRNINADIGSLVNAGLDRRVQQALDAVRVIGNNAVHPGQMDLRDDRATAETLFKLLNLIVEKTISEPRHVAEVYDSLPEAAREAIERRDES